MEKLIVGKITKTHGIKGAVKVSPVIDEDIEFADLKGVYIDNDAVFHEFEDVFAVSDVLGVKFKDVNSVNEANQIVGKWLYADKVVLENLTDENSFFIEDLKGSKVFLDSDKNDCIGIVEEIDNFGSADIFYIKSSKYKNLTLPHIEGVISLFDLENKKLYLSAVKFNEVAVYDY